MATDMARNVDFDELTAVYEALVDCNRRIGALLERHEGLGRMAPIFAEKAVLNGRLAKSLPWLEKLKTPEAAGQDLGNTLTAQANAARSEARLVEQLAAFVPSVKKNFAAYQQTHPKGTGKEWDMRG